LLKFIYNLLGLMSRLVEKTVLIDDSEIDLFIQRRFLEVYSFSAQLIQFKSATQAITWLKSLNGEAPPDVIFLDLNMPEMDGFGFLEAFLQLPEETKASIRIVVLTSSNSAQDRKQAFENPNVIHFITKPIRQSEIEDLRELLKKSMKKTSLST
jgi:two-component system, NarL family, nitrate/nitrite response regulator NarL